MCVIENRFMACLLQVIDEEGLQLRSGKVGEVFLRGMMQLRDEFEVVGDVRGKGLMLALEMVKSKVGIPSLF